MLGAVYGQLQRRQGATRTSGSWVGAAAWQHQRLPRSLLERHFLVAGEQAQTAVLVRCWLITTLRSSWMFSPAPGTPRTCAVAFGHRCAACCSLDMVPLAMPFSHYSAEHALMQACFTRCRAELGSGAAGTCGLRLCSTWQHSTATVACRTAGRRRRVAQSYRCAAGHQQPAAVQRVAPFLCQ